MHSLKDGILPPLEASYVEAQFDRLSSLDVALDPDPLIYGPKRLNQKVALARTMLTICERMFLDVSRLHATYKRSERAATLLLDMSKKTLLANDPEVRSGRAVSERDAIASGKLKSEVEAVAAATSSLQELDAILTVIKAKRSDLRDLQGRLRDQMRLCQDELSLGAKWGSKLPPDRVDVLERATGEDVARASQLIPDALQALSTSETEEPEAIEEEDAEEETEEDSVDLLLQENPLPPNGEDPPVLEPTSTPDEVDAFFEASISDPTPAPKTAYAIQEEDALNLDMFLSDI